MRAFTRDAFSRGCASIVIEINAVIKRIWQISWNYLHENVEFIPSIGWIYGTFTTLVIRLSHQTEKIRGRKWEGEGEGEEEKVLALTPYLVRQMGTTSRCGSEYHFPTTEWLIFDIKKKKKKDAYERSRGMPLQRLVGIPILKQMLQ